MATAAPADMDLPPHFIGAMTDAADWLVVVPVALALAGAGLLVMLRGRVGLQAWLAALVTLAIAVSNGFLLARVLAEGPVAMTMGRWLPPFGITFAVDALGAVFALTTSLVMLAVMIYAPLELDSRKRTFGFYPLMLLLLCGVSGAFLTGDLFNLYVWFEVMLIASFGLLVMGGTPIQLDAAIKYGFLNILATTVFLVATAYTYGLTGTLNMADLLTATAEAPLPALVTAGALFIVAFGVKAAAFPGNAWLPASYHAPMVAVSAVFGALLTKVGVYALIRLFMHVMPSAGDVLNPAIAAVAVATLIVAPLGAIASTNLRRAVGFFVIGGVGMILAGLVLGNQQGLAGAAVYAVHSMLAMAALYLAAGLVERMTGTTDTRRMGGVYAQSPLLSAAFILVVFAVSGLPPFLSLWSKILLLQGGVSAGDWIVVAAILLNAILTIIAASRLWAHVFWRSGHEGEGSERPNPDIRPLDRTESRLGLGALAVLMVLIVVVGLFPDALIAAGQIAAADLLDPQHYVEAVFAEVPQP